MQGHGQFLIITIFLVVMLTTFHSGEALKCYNCTTENETCKTENLSPNQAVTCPANLCARFTQEIMGKDVITRVCGYNDFCKSIIEAPLTKNCIECDTDMCNASTTNAVSTIIMITSGLITLLWTIQN